ncbi:MAG: AmmeMemoRadiSam system protein B, partial [Gemmataceae bacterium]
MKHLEKPCLRPYLSVTRVRESSPPGRDFLIRDPLRIATNTIMVTQLELQFLSLLDGTRTLRALQKDIENMIGKGSAPLEAVRSFVISLDYGLFLHSPRFEELAQSPIRPYICHGVFPEKPAAFRKFMRGLFTKPGASGLPTNPRKNKGLKGILAPHIDYHRGGIQYTPAFRALYEETEATLFVIIGTSHHCGWRRFTLTRKNFQTPLGTVRTHQEYIDRLVEKVDVDLFEDEWMAHLPEHSIELEVAFLHYLFPDNPDLAIVPIVVGSFEEFVEQKKDPAKCPVIKNV